jgi:hypothetical protein
MSLSISPYVKITTGQLTVNPAGVGESEGLLTIGNDLRSDGKANNEYRMRVVKSDTPLVGGHLLHESINYDGDTPQTKVYLQYNHTAGKLSVPEAQLMETPSHNVLGAFNCSGNATILGNLTVGGSFVPSITSLASLNVANLRSTNLTSLNIVGDDARIRNITATNLTVDSFVSNTIISSLSVDNGYIQDAVVTNLTCLNPIVGSLAVYPNTFSSLVATDLTVVNPIQGTLASFPSAYNNLTVTNLNTSNITSLNSINAFGLTLSDDLRLPINSAEFLKTSGSGFVQSGSFASVQVGTALTALDALACSGNSLTATTATDAVNIQRYARTWYASPAGSGDGNFSSPCNFQTALLFAKAYADANPSHYQAIYLNVGEYGQAGVPFDVNVPRLSIIGMSESKGAIQIVEGLNYSVASAFDADNEYNMVANCSIFNQAGVNCINYVPTAKMYLTVKNCFVFATGNFHAINAQPTDLASRLYLDGSELSANGTQETIHLRRGILWQCSRSAITSKSTAPALRVSNSGSVSAIDNSVFASTYAVVNAQSVISFDVAGNCIISNSTIQGASANTDLTGIDITNNAGVLVANNLQVAVYGTGAGASKALRGTGAGSLLYTNQNNAVGVALAGQNVVVGGLAIVNQTKV